MSTTPIDTDAICDRIGLTDVIADVLVRRAGDLIAVPCSSKDCDGTVSLHPDTLRDDEDDAALARCQECQYNGLPADLRDDGIPDWMIEEAVIAALTEDRERDAWGEVIEDKEVAA